MGTLHYKRSRNMFNKKILKTINQPNSSSLYLKYILHIIDTIIDILSRYVLRDIFICILYV